MSFIFVFFNDTATTEIYTLSLHDALPILRPRLRSTTSAGPSSPKSSSAPASSRSPRFAYSSTAPMHLASRNSSVAGTIRSEEHTSELQSRQYLVCRLLLEKKKNQSTTLHI